MSRFSEVRVDADLVTQALAGDARARRAVYEAVSGPVFALVHRIVRDRSTAEDLFQDAMETLFQRLGTWRGEAPFGFWVRQIALRRCLMHLRSPWQRARQTLSDLLPPEVEPAATPPLAEMLDLSRALDRLAPAARTVLWLHDVEGLSHEEIATAFGRTPSFSKSQLSRARSSLRAWLEPEKETWIPQATS